MNIVNMQFRELGINLDAQVMIDSLRPVKAADLFIYGGTPMTLYKGISDTDSYLVSYKYLQSISATTNVPFWGLADFANNAYKQETFDPLGYNGSGFGSSMLIGRASIYNGRYRQVDGSFVKVASFVTTDTFTPMAPLYVDLTETSAGLPGTNYGKITVTKSTGVNDKTFLGYCAGYWIQNLEPVLEVFVARTPIAI